MLLCSAVDEKQLQQLLMCKTSAQMWSRLTMLHQQSKSYFLLERFWTHQMQEGDDRTSHVSTVETMARQIEDLGEKPPSDDAITFVILCSLPPSYRGLREAWDSVSKEEQTIEALTRRLLKRERWNKTSGVEEEAADKALFAAKIGSSGNKPNATIPEQKKQLMQDWMVALKKMSKCYYCHEIGHCKRECEKRNRDMEESTQADPTNEVFGF